VSVFVLDAAGRVLVFAHPEAPEAGIQVPAGTMEPGEEPEAAALRELCEETGLATFAITRFLARRELFEVRQGREEHHDRWFYQAVATAPLPEEWLGGEDSAVEGWIPFRFFWLSRAEAELVLTRDHAEVLGLVVAE
jgi:8-oxo-dGTP pyrophosphatase MutT (NUDIX family)